ncbi:glutathione S-transferase T1-like [Mercurialis annua]|uniref:glutathione S-transferase T1-like n=1 Tax=Mercurialis annua TaxID=3986 RepID=UPI00215F6B55|nr:glutathione S-transferase T1-like [Mercurialis annua]
MKLKLYMHPLSQPSRALIIFCKINGIEFEEIVIDLTKGQHKSPDFTEINPMGQVPAIAHGDFKLFESHAILIYLASVFPGVADHWYPTDVQKRAKIHSVLDWHHSNLRRGSVIYGLNRTLGPVFGLPLNPKAAAEGEKLLCSSLSQIESVWLADGGPFLVGGDKTSIADISLVCEIMQLQVYILDESERNRFLEPYKKIVQWIENIKNATRLHFDEVHYALYKFSAMLKHKSEDAYSCIQ